MSETNYSAECIKCKKKIPTKRNMLCPECYRDVFNISPYFCFKCKEIYPNKESCPKCNIPLGREEENKE